MRSPTPQRSRNFGSRVGAGGMRFWNSLATSRDSGRALLKDTSYHTKLGRIGKYGHAPEVREAIAIEILGT